MSRETRYVVGIDLGTTNTVISYVDTQAETPEVRALAVPQVVAPGQIDTRESLPSFLYLAAGPELSYGALDLPWTAGRKHCVGAFAREQSSKVPTRVVSSAKSWLCHSGVDRTSPLLPWQAPEDVQRISPLDASTVASLCISTSSARLAAIERTVCGSSLDEETPPTSR